MQETAWAANAILNNNFTVNFHTQPTSEILSSHRKEGNQKVFKKALALNSQQEKFAPMI